jgi:hypothetical protein
LDCVKFINEKSLLKLLLTTPVFSYCCAWAEKKTVVNIFFSSKNLFLSKFSVYLFSPVTKAATD